MRAGPALALAALFVAANALLTSNSLKLGFRFSGYRYFLSALIAFPRYHGLLPPPLAVSDVHSEQRVRGLLTRSRVSWADTKKPRPTGGAAGEVKVALHLASAPAVRLVQS